MDEVITQAQERLEKKRLDRKTQGMETGPLILSISSALNEWEERLPKCVHGIRVNLVCEECKATHALALAKDRREKELASKVYEEGKRKSREENPERWLKEYQVPAKFMGCSFDNFTGGDQVKAICRTFPKESILLSGKTGCGKTHLAVATLREFIIKSETPIYSNPIFITSPELLLHIRSCFATNSDEFALVDRYSKAPVLILDDLGADKATEWAVNTLYLIIDRRNKDLLPTFITTNLSIQEIENQYGARIASRLSDMKIVEIKMADYRKRRAA